MKLAALIFLAAHAAIPPADAFSDVIGAFQSVQQGGSRNKAARMIENAGAFPASDGDTLSRHWPKAHVGKSDTYRDRTLGPAYKVLSLAPGKTAQFEQIFMAGQRARITVVPRQGTRFQLSVIDDDGKRQCNVADRAACDWTPIWTSRYRIELSNPGHIPALYYVVMQ